MSSVVRQKITSVVPGSPAAEAGILSGEILLSINGEPVKDLVDYEYLSAAKRLKIGVEDASGRERIVSVRKGEAEPLGLDFDSSLMSEMRTCCNRCLFCFVDQMPKNMRPTLSVKDDDWRMSFIMGNYVTLTNASEEEFDRLIRRRVSPIFVSVHATDPDVRVRLMRNRTAGSIMERLTRLRDAGLHFHAQVVACPGLNDGPVLEKTLSDLKSLYPGCLSVAVVPVGLTKFREKLFPLRGYTPEEARAMIAYMRPFQESCRQELGTTLVWLSDEWYLLAGEELPPYAHYEGFDQIENGVGLLRLFEDDFEYALSEREPRRNPVRVSVAGGYGCREFVRRLLGRLYEYNIEVDHYPIRNEFFGGNVSVAGLVTASDLTGQLEGRLKTETLLIPGNMLRERESVFLDDVTLSELEGRLGVRILPFHGGEEFVEILFGDQIK